MKKDTIFGIVLLIWFLASFAGIFVVAGMEQGWLIPVIMGQVFVILGIFFIVSFMKSGNFGYTEYLLFLFPLLGLGCIIGGFVFHYGGSEVISRFEVYLPYVILGVFVLLGIFTIGVWYRNTVYLVERCSQRIEAKCIDFKSQYRIIDNSRVLTFCPIYQFYYNGNTYEVCNNIYSNLADFRVNEVYDIYINPNKPEQFYQPAQNKRAAWGSLIVGTILIVFPSIVMVLYTNGLNGGR